MNLPPASLCEKLQKQEGGKTPPDLPPSGFWPTVAKKQEAGGKKIVFAYRIAPTKKTKKMLSTKRFVEMFC